MLLFEFIFWCQDRRLIEIFVCTEEEEESSESEDEEEIAPSASFKKSGSEASQPQSAYAKVVVLSLFIS